MYARIPLSQFVFSVTGTTPAFYDKMHNRCSISLQQTIFKQLRNRFCLSDIDTFFAKNMHFTERSGVFLLSLPQDQIFLLILETPFQPAMVEMYHREEKALQEFNTLAASQQLKERKNAMNDTFVYHGSPNLFDTFCYDKIGTNATSEGKGFYFTSSKEVASDYGTNGYLYTVHLQYKKPLSSHRKRITREQLKTYLIALDDQTDYLSNWGDASYEGYDTVLQRAVEGEYTGSDNDVALIGGICSGSGSIKKTLSILHQTLGYDSIITDADWREQRLFIALVPHIITFVSVEKQ